jgi:hypothetical protein
MKQEGIVAFDQQEKIDPMVEAITKDVDDLIAFQATEAYKNLVTFLRRQIEQGKYECFTAEKMNDVVKGQATVSLVNECLASFREPMDRYQRFQRESPLFAQNIGFSLRWNEDAHKLEKIQR